MNKQIVLIVDEDSLRTEKLVFIVRLGGYKTRTVDTVEEALNWSKYGCHEEDVLGLLCNNPGKFDRARQIVTVWIAAGRTVPAVLLQRGKGDWNHLLPIGEDDHFFVCDPESVMQTLEILTAIRANRRCSAQECGEEITNGRGDVVQCK